MEKKAHDLKPILNASATASADDFQMLLACIHKFEEGDSLQTPGQRYSDRQHITQQPENSPIRDPLRLSEVLDAIANFCVSQEKGEVIAIGLKVTSADAEITVATNSDVDGYTGVSEHGALLWN